MSVGTEGISARCKQPTAIWQKVRLPIGRNVKNGHKRGTKGEKERERGRDREESLSRGKSGEKRGREEEQQRGKFARSLVGMLRYSSIVEEGHSNGYVAKKDR